MKTVTAKFMHEKLKKNWTTQEFAQYFEVSEEQFLKKLKETFGIKAHKGMISQLKKNAKKPKCSSNTVTEDTPELIMELPTNKEDIETKIETDVDTESEIDNSEALETLMFQREEISSLINDLELQHKELVSDRGLIKNQIGEYKKLLLQYKQEIEKVKTSISGLISKLDEKLNKMVTINAEISSYQELLKELDVKIEDMRKITIFMFSTGEFEIDSALEFDIPDNDEIFYEIVKDERSELLTIKQIRSLTKVITLVMLLKQQNLVFELSAEIPVVEEIFYKMV